MELEPPRFCSTPLVMKLAIQDIQPFSVVVSWQSRNHSGLHGYNVAYRSLDKIADPVSFFFFFLNHQIFVVCLIEIRALIHGEEKKRKTFCCQMMRKQ